jgi:flagellar biosynthesis/type III secretory pathway M-ring protein FliF/YscJ
MGNNASTHTTIYNSAPEIVLTSPQTGDEFSEDDTITFQFNVIDSDPADLEKLQYVIFDQNNNKKIDSAYVPSDTGTVKVLKSLEKGTFNIRINVSDGESSSEIQLEIIVKSTEPDPLESFILPLFIGILILIVILVIAFLILINRINRMKQDKEKNQVSDEKTKAKGKDKGVALIDEDLLSVEEPVSEEEPISEKEDEFEDMETDESEVVDEEVDEEDLEEFEDEEF